MRAFLPLLMLALVGTLAAGVSAEGWSSPTNISSSSGDSKRPAVAVGVDGSVHVVWEDQSPGNWEIFYASRAPGGLWSPPANVSNNAGGSFRPAVAVGPDASVHVVWHDDTPGDYEIFHAVKAPGGEWSTPVNISNSSKWSYWPSLVVRAEGFVHAAWHDSTPGNWEALSASKPPDAAWSPATNISRSAGTSFTPRLLVAGDGSVHAVWQDDSSGTWEIFSASRPPEGPWSAPLNVSNTDEDSAPFAAAQSPDGSILVVWREATSSGPRLLSATKSPGRPWSAPEDIGGEVGGSERFVIGLTNDGSLHLLWDGLRAGDREILVSSRAPGGPWSSSLNISKSPVDSRLGGLATGRDGSLHVVWRDGVPGKGDTFYSERSAERAPEGAVPSEGAKVVRLTRGCTLLTSSYPNSTPAEALASAVSPAHILVSLWKPKAVGWAGYSPSYPQVSDLFRQDYGEDLFICASGEGEFARAAP